MNILVTRPQPQAGKTAQKLIAMGHDVIVEPMLRFQPLTVDRDVAGDAKAIAVTSANAIELWPLMVWSISYSTFLSILWARRQPKLQRFPVSKMCLRRKGMLIPLAD